MDKCFSAWCAVKGQLSTSNLYLSNAVHICDQVATIDLNPLFLIVRLMPDKSWLMCQNQPSHINWSKHGIQIRISNYSQKYDNSNPHLVSQWWTNCCSENSSHLWCWRNKDRYFRVLRVWYWHISQQFFQHKLFWQRSLKSWNGYINQSIKRLIEKITGRVMENENEGLCEALHPLNLLCGDVQRMWFRQVLSITFCSLKLNTFWGLSSGQMLCKSGHFWHVYTCNSLLIHWQTHRYQYTWCSVLQHATHYRQHLKRSVCWLLHFKKYFLKVKFKTDIEHFFLILLY